VISRLLFSADFQTNFEKYLVCRKHIQKNLLQSLASGTQCEPLSEIKTISENISSGGRGKKGVHIISNVGQTFPNVLLSFCFL
jgi:hypothetical protein